MYKEIQGAWEKIKKALVLSSSLWFKGGNVFNYMNEKKKITSAKIEETAIPPELWRKDSLQRLRKILWRTKYVNTK